MSVFAPTEIMLKDGAQVCLRSPEVVDAPRLLEYLDAVRRETDYLQMSPADPLPSLEWERQWIASIRAGSGVQIVAECKAGEVIALCRVSGGEQLKVRHRGEVAISTRAAWANRGLGTALMQQLIEWAEASDDINILTLSLHHDNTRASRVYTKLGFTQDGIRPRTVKRPDGYADEVMMSRWVGGQLIG